MFSIVKSFVLIKALQLLVVIFTPIQFDISNDIIVDIYGDPTPVWLKDLAKKFLVWDNVHFTELFANGIQYEHQYVFSPGWWRLVRYITLSIKGENTPSFYEYLTVGVVMSNLNQLLTSIVLYYFTKHFFKQIAFYRSKRETLAKKTAIVFLLSPGGMFLTSSYSENLGSFLAILGLYLRQASLSYKILYTIQYKSIYLLSGIIVGTCFLVRANCLLLGLFYVYDLYTFFIIDHNLPDAVMAIIGGTPLFTTLVGFNYYCYQSFCPERGEWCNNMIPSLFAYAQKHYWNNGFLNYWTANNIPNFLISLPIVLINSYLIKYFIREYPVKQFIPYLMVNGVTLILGVFFWNIQILNRVLNFNPVFYWFLAVDNSKNNKIILIGILTWIIIHSGLFASFLPPA